MTLYPDVSPTPRARAHAMDGNVVSNVVGRRRRRLRSEVFFVGVVLIAQASWLGGLGYLVFRFL